MVSGTRGNCEQHQGGKDGNGPHRREIQEAKAVVEAGPRLAFARIIPRKVWQGPLRRGLVPALRFKPREKILRLSDLGKEVGKYNQSGL